MNDVVVKLSQLPKTLEDSYERILNSIPEEDWAAAHCILQLLKIS